MPSTLLSAFYFIRTEISEASLVTKEQECYEVGLDCAVSQRDSSDAVLQAAAQLLVANRSLQLQRVEHEQVRLLDCV